MTTADERFEALLAETAAEMPDKDSADQITKGFRKTWDHPPLEALELLTRRTYNHREARLLIFFPEPVDMASYVGLIAAAPRGAPDAHPQNKVRKPFLALLYMKHAQSWKHAREFIREGGLLSLADLFEDDNAPLRAQAIDIFMQLTSCELHDWFHEPPLEPAVHRRWIDLAGPEAAFVSKMEANFGDQAVFPGGSFYCLQILAFWLSLLRYFYCEQRVLRLGTRLMDMLKKWATTPGLIEEETALAVKLRDDFARFPTVASMNTQLIGVAGTGTGQTPEEALAAAGPAAAMATGGEGGGASSDASSSAAPPPAQGADARATPEEPSIVEISDAEPNAAAPPAGTEFAQERIHIADLKSAPAPKATGVADCDESDGPTLKAPCVLSSADEAAMAKAKAEAADAPGWQELKKAGNAAFGRSDILAAVQCYSAALEVAPPSEHHLIMGNRSAACLKLISLLETESDPETTLADAVVGLLAAKGVAPPSSPDHRSGAGDDVAAVAATRLAELAAHDARTAVRMQPSFTKGYYRLGTALLSAGQPGAAVTALEDGLSRSPQNDELREALRKARGAQELARRTALKQSKQAASAAPISAAAASTLSAATAGTADGTATGEAVTAASPRRSKPAVDYEKAATAAARAAELSEQKGRAAAGAPPTEPVGAAAAGTAAAGSGPLPATAQQFDREWSSLVRRGSLEEQVAWMSRLPAAQYAPLFKESLTEPTLCSLLQCALDWLRQAPPTSGAAAFVHTLLNGLASTRRFEMLLMFLDEKQKTIVRSLITELKRAGMPLSEAQGAAWRV